MRLWLGNKVAALGFVLVAIDRAPNKPSSQPRTRPVAQNDVALPGLAGQVPKLGHQQHLMHGNTSLELCHSYGGSRSN
jgi:hypothetical protein